MSEIWEDSDGTRISNEPYHQALAISRLGHGYDRQNQPSIKQRPYVDFGHYGLFHKMGGGSPYEISGIERCYQFRERACHS